MIKKFENFSGKVKYNLLTEEVTELASILINMKPNLPDEFPNEELSKLINNYVIYTSEDGVYRISVILHESDTYRTEDDEIIHGKYKTIYIIKIYRADDAIYDTSEVRDFVKTINGIIRNQFEGVSSIVKVNDERISEEEFNKDIKTEKVSLIFKIL